MGHGKVDMSVQDFSGLRLDHSRAVQSIVTVNIAASALVKLTEIWKISPCSTSSMAMKERLQGKYLEVLGLV